MLSPSSAGSVNHAHDVYNFFHSQIRIHIERAFGILNTVFGILQKPLKSEVPTCCRIVQACLRLHNYRIDRGCQVYFWDCLVCQLSCNANFTSMQKVRQSQHLQYAHADDAFNLLLSDERYLTAEHVNTRTRYELCILLFSVYDWCLFTGMNASTWTRHNGGTSLFKRFTMWLLCALRTTLQGGLPVFEFKVVY